MWTFNQLCHFVLINWVMNTHTHITHTHTYLFCSHLFYWLYLSYFTFLLSPSKARSKAHQTTQLLHCRPSVSTEIWVDRTVSTFTWHTVSVVRSRQLWSSSPTATTTPPPKRVLYYLSWEIITWCATNNCRTLLKT